MRRCSAGATGTNWCVSEAPCPNYGGKTPGHTVHQHSGVRVLKQGMCAQDGVVRLNDRRNPDALLLEINRSRLPLSGHGEGQSNGVRLNLHVRGHLQLTQRQHRRSLRNTTRDIHKSRPSAEETWEPATAKKGRLGPGLASRRGCVLTAIASRPEAAVWAPLVGRPADYLPSGTAGQWPPAPFNGGPIT